MTTPSSSSLSHALNLPTLVQKPQSDLPRLQLAPPEHQKHLQTQAQVRQQREAARKTSSVSPTEQRQHLSSSREASPAVGVETTQVATGEKRKLSAPRNTNTKKRRTDQALEEPREVPLQYGLGTHYPYTYAYPGAPPPPPLPAFHPPMANSTAETGFNEFQWRLLNLCGEFYEAATELIRSTPHLVLSQAFQLLGRGAGLDPISILNDARRTCDVMLTNPQALATAPPPPTSLPLPVLTSLAHLNSRSNVAVAPTATIAPPLYYPPPAPQPIAPGEKISDKGKEKERVPNNVQGTWKDHEVQKLKALAEKYRARDKVAVAEEEEEEEEEAEDGEGEGEAGSSTQPPKKVRDKGDVDWDKVVAEFGEERSRHQVLIKATYLGLKPSSSLPGKKTKRKRHLATELPPLTISSAKSIPVSYSNFQLGTAPSPSTSPSANATSPVDVAPTKLPTVAPTSANMTSSPDSQKVVVPPPVPQHSHVHAPYAPPGWYPHPQNPYYAYHQPMYYSPHPQGYGIQSYGIHSPSQQGYYGQSYPPPPGIEMTTTEKQTLGKAKRKEARKNGGPTFRASNATDATPVPPPSLPPKQPTVESPSSKSASTPGAPLPTEVQKSTSSTPLSTPVVPPASTGTISTTTGSSGVLRRGPNNSLFTYTPLPHGPGGAVTEPSK